MKKSKHVLATAFLAVCAAASSFAQTNLGADCGCPSLASRDTILMSSLVDNTPGATFGNLLSTVTNLTCDHIYKLDTRVYVPASATLNIQAGSLISATYKPVATEVTTIIVTRGGKINAVGTESCPIVFTAKNDKLDGNYSDTITSQWGGLIILGKAFNNTKLGDPMTTPVLDGGADGVCFIEGLPSSDNRHHYGMPTGQADDNDNSGILKYVSIRHGGAIIGLANEINGLTLGSVGRGTTLDHIEILATQDDGIEFFGGSVDIKYATVIYAKDDCFDWDQGYSGRGQFLYGVQFPGSLSQAGSHGLELDGDDVSGRLPLSNAKFFNVTLIGNNDALNNAIEAKARTQGEVSNSVFANFAKGVNINTNVVPFYTAGTWITKNNSFINVATLVAPAAQATQFATDGNVTSAANGIDYTLEKDVLGTITGYVNPVPGELTFLTNYFPPMDNFFTRVTYRGAFKPFSAPWTMGWTTEGVGQQALPCPKDLNHDGKIDAADILLVSGGFNTNCN